MAQAAGLFPIGSAEHPTAIICIAGGGALSLEIMPEKRPILRAAQALLVAIALIIIF